ncbi:MAG: glucose-6-phosphate isomerase, partial [Gammaproteobacteria bacterium]|nr:glucose-6-phosphate isomerase [Gammaproteobacteria bacterium]
MMLNEIWDTLQREGKRMMTASLRELNEDSQRFEDFSVLSDGMLLDFSKEKVDRKVMQELQNLASASQITESRSRLFGGETINFTEQRRVLHMALRRGV